MKLKKKLSTKRRSVSAKAKSVATEYVSRKSVPESIKIERGVDIPAKGHRSPYINWGEVLSSMKIGDSFVLLRPGWRPAISSAARRLPDVYVIIRVDAVGNERCWRVTKSQKEKLEK